MAIFFPICQIALKLHVAPTNNSHFKALCIDSDNVLGSGVVGGAVISVVAVVVGGVSVVVGGVSVVVGGVSVVVGGVSEAGGISEVVGLLSDVVGGVSVVTECVTGSTVSSGRVDSESSG